MMTRKEYGDDFICDLEELKAYAQKNNLPVCQKTYKKMIDEFYNRYIVEHQNLGLK